MISLYVALEKMQRAFEQASMAAEDRLAFGLRQHEEQNRRIISLRVAEVKLRKTNEKLLLEKREMIEENEGILRELVEYRGRDSERCVSQLQENLRVLVQENLDLKNQLAEQTLKCQVECERLTKKNSVLKHNFFIIEAKYKKLRDDLLLEAGNNRKEKEKENVVSTEANPVVRRTTTTPKIRRSKTEVSAATTGSADNSGKKALKRSLTEASVADSSRKRSRETGKFVEVVRGKNARAALPGHDCEECRAFYTALQRSGVVSKESMAEHLQLCSRHKHASTPPDTPEGFWSNNMSMPTP